MTGLLQRLAQRAIAGAAPSAALPALAPLFAPARDARADARVAEGDGNEAVDIAPPMASSRRVPAPIHGTVPVEPRSTHVTADDGAASARASVPATPMPLTPRPSEATAAATPRAMAESSFEVSQPSRSARPVERRGDVVPRDAVVAASSPEERRLGWPPPPKPEADLPAPSVVAKAADRAVRRAVAIEPNIEAEPSLAAKTLDASTPTPVRAVEGRVEAAPMQGAPRQSAPAPQSRARERPEEHEEREEDAPPVQVIPAGSHRDLPLAVATSRAGAEGKPADEGAAPVIHVTIGRIDVRAVTPPPAAAAAPAAARTPRLSLDEFLARRSGRPR